MRQPSPLHDGVDGESESAEHRSRHMCESDMQVKTAPYDHRFPSFNQARHCFTRYNEFYK